MHKKNNFATIRRNVLVWLDSLRIKDADYGVYRFCEGGNPTILASCFALFIRELLDDLGSLSDDERHEWTSHIKNCQDSSSGLFYDPLFKEEDLSGKHDAGYFTHQNTMFCLSALNALDSEPDYNLQLLSSYSKENVVKAWLDALDWSDPWLISNNVMYIMYFLQDDYKRNKSEKSLEILDFIFEYLNQIQDYSTGFWGTDRGANIFHGMAGAFHFYFFYFDMLKPVKYSKEIIDHTLALQNNDGLFTPMGGGGHCDDLDAIDILVKFSMLSLHRADDVLQALLKAFDQLLNNQNSDGGFCYAKVPFYSVPDWMYCLRLLLPVENLDSKTRFWMVTRKVGSQVLYPKVKKWTWMYSSWKLMSCQVNKSDLWSTYFRLLAIALISSRYPDKFNYVPEWKFRNYGIGWHSLDIGNNQNGDDI